MGHWLRRKFPCFLANLRLALLVVEIWKNDTINDKSLYKIIEGGGRILVFSGMIAQINLAVVNEQV